MRRRPRVLVTDAEQRSVLAACRGLAAGGYHVSTVAAERLALGHWSRFSSEQITLPGAEADPEGYVERISHVLRRGEYDLVVPGTEVSLLPISERRDLIEPFSCLGLPPHEVVLQALDKPMLCGRAAAVGLAPPRSITCSSSAEAFAAARKLAFPLVVKPTRSVRWEAGRIRHQRVQVLMDATLFEAAVAEVGVPVILQEYVPATTIFSFAAVRAGSRLLGITFVRYIRTYPLQRGSAALATTINPPRRLTEQIEELLGLIGWQGIFELELLKLGENRFGAIDFNPRPFGWMALALGADANLPALWGDYILRRRSVSPNGARIGINYRWEDGDIRNALALLRRRRLHAAAAVLRPHRRVVHAHFRIDDPAPLVARILWAAQRALSGRSIRANLTLQHRAMSVMPQRQRACERDGYPSRSR